MRFSVWPDVGRPWAEVLALTTHAEQTGWDGVYVADHFMPNGSEPLDGPMAECWTTLAGLAACVPRLRLGTLVCGNTYRHPAVLAKQAATVDQLSGGRLVLGLGAGWQENEHAAYGLHFGTVRERMDRFEEACQVVTSLLHQTRSTFEGAHYRLTDAPCDPKPVQDHLPLLLGGGGEKRTLRIVARYADEWNVWGTPDLCTQKAAVLARHCEEADRDPSTILRSTQALVWIDCDVPAGVGRAAIGGTAEQLVDTVFAYRDAGIDELIVPDFNLGRSLTERLDRYDRLAEVLHPLR